MEQNEIQDMIQKSAKSGKLTDRDTALSAMLKVSTVAIAAVTVMAITVVIATLAA